MEIEKTIRDYLPQVIHMSLATSANDQPWVCEVHFVSDDDLNLYFRSTPQRRHSLEIENNAKVAGNIITQHFLGQKVRGVYFEGTAEKLIDVTEEHPAYLEYAKRFGCGPEILEEATKDTGHHFYKITVHKFALFDGYESSPSTKFELDWEQN